MTFSTLKDGPTLPDEVLQLVWDLDLRGFVLSSHGDNLYVSPIGTGNAKPSLSVEDRSSIRLWKLHLLQVVAYCSVDH